MSEPVVPRHAWTLRAKCRELQYSQNLEIRDMMFPNARAAAQIAAAKRYCLGCPVSAQCLQDGLGDAHAVRAGLTADERRRLRRGATFDSWASCLLPFVPRPANPSQCTGCTGGSDREVTPQDYKDEIIAMHREGVAGEQICEHYGFSRDEVREAGKDWGVALMRRIFIECGTPAAAARHRRRREPLCAPCAGAEQRRIAARRKQLVAA
ncbi:MAG: WhiB family transcriptional regulator [Mycobacterium sp.]